MTTFPNPLNIFPGAGGNWQEIFTRWWSPNISLNFAGDAGIEREVNEDVASYGRQIGWLNDIVEALVAAAPNAVKANTAAEDSLKKLQDAQQKIDAIKRRRKTSALDKARTALSALDQDDYKRLLRSLDPDHPPGTA
ncbi:MAG TPA: hypothetical protein VGF53_09690 [Pseudolabrys sp.]|jgi:hypothetical protein